MNDYFEHLEQDLRAVVRERRHLRWYSAVRLRHHVAWRWFTGRRPLVALAAAVVAAVVLLGVFGLGRFADWSFFGCCRGSGAPISRDRNSAADAASGPVPVHRVKLQSARNRWSWWRLSDVGDRAPTALGGI